MRGEDPPTAVTQTERDEAAARLTSGELPLGARVGRYVVLRPVGEGGMGMVYASYDPDLDRQVALKVLREDRLGDIARDLLLAEAQSLARLRHANVLAVHDVGQTDEGRVFMAFDLVDGSDVLAWSRAARRSWREIVRVFLDAGRGLAAAHAGNLVHRDFKPTNVLIERTGHVYVADFGIARRADAEPTRSSSVEESEDPRPIAGTRPYIAPEVVAGTRASFLSDQYSFGVSLHEILFGHRPGQPAPAEVRRVPAFVRRAIARMTAEHADDRFASLDDALRALADDPGRRVRIGAAVLVAVAVIATPIVLALRPAAQPPPPCPTEPDPLAGIWDDARRNEMTAALAARMTAPDLANVTKRLDAYATKWRASHHDACIATRVRGDQSEALMAARMACLDGRRAGLRALADALTKTKVTDSAARAVSRLAEIELCEDRTLLTNRAVLPESAAQRAAIDQLRAEFSARRAEYDLGQTTAAEARGPATQLAERARAIGYAPLLAETLKFRSATEPVALAIATDIENMGVAQAARDYETQVRLAPALIIDLCNFARYGEATVVTSFARGAFIAAGKPPALEDSMIAVQLMHAICESRPAEAIEFGTQLYTRRIKSSDPFWRFTAASDANNVAQSYVYLEDPENALMWSDRAHAALAEFAKVNSTTLQIRYGTTVGTLLLGDVERIQGAIAVFEHGIDVLGDDAMACTATRLRGHLALAQDDRIQASALFDEALACADKHGLAEELDMQLGRLARAELTLLAGTPKQALEQARKGAAIVARDPNDRKIVLFRAVIARALVRMGKLADAEHELELTTPMLPADARREERWAVVQLARAELAVAKRDAAKAVELAKAAREVRLRRNDLFHVHQLDALLARGGR